MKGDIMKIALVVDDTSYIRTDIRKILEKQGYTVYEAINGEHGLELYKKVKPMIVTMDINMPKMNGLKATKEITLYDKEAKIMICSSMISFGDYKDEAREAGAKAFLGKPFTEIEFLEEITKLFL